MRGLIARIGAGRVFIREPLIGRFRAPFERLRFAGNAPGQSARGDAGLVVRSLIGEVRGGGEAQTPPMLELFGIPIVNTTISEAVDWIAARAVTGDPALLAFVNPDCLNIAYVDAEYRRILLEAARVLPDGIGIHIGCRMP